MLRQRLIFGTLLAAAIAALIVLDGYLATREPPAWPLPGSGLNLGVLFYNGGLCTLVVAVFAWLAAGELLTFARARGHQPFDAIAKVFALGLVVGPMLAIHVRAQTGWYDASWETFWLALALALAFLLQGLRRRTENAAADIAATMLVILYAGALAGFLVKLRVEVGGSAGVAILGLTVIAVKMADTGAYFTGRALGRHKLIPWLSPGKTWEGFFGGLIVAVLATVLAGLYLRDRGLLPATAGFWTSLWGLGIFGLLMGLISVAGDLCASLLKRDAALKDSGKGLPGMGGMLDVFDSPLFAAPFAWFFWIRLAHLGMQSAP